jgi:hypothetical protein
VRLVPIVGGALVAAAGVVWFGYLRFGGSSAVVTTSGVGVFRSEYDAAYVGSASIKAAPALATLGQGENVSVLWDTYGKDYWACYVRTSANQRGWVLCGALRRLG